MTDFNPEGYSLGDMTEDEKDALILKLSLAYNEQLINVAALHDSFSVLSQHLDMGDVFGKRGETMRDLSHRMKIIGHIIRQWLGIDLKQMQVDADFEDLVRDLEVPSDE